LQEIHDHELKKEHITAKCKGSYGLYFQSLPY